MLRSFGFLAISSLIVYVPFLHYFSSGLARRSSAARDRCPSVRPPSARSSLARDRHDRAADAAAAWMGARKRKRERERGRKTARAMRASKRRNGRKEVMPPSSFLRSAI